MLSSKASQSLLVVLFLCSLALRTQLASADHLPIVSKNENEGFHALGLSTPAVRLQIIAAFLLGVGTSQQIVIYCGKTTAFTVETIVLG